MSYTTTSTDKWRSVEWETPNTSLPPQAPEHPIQTMQGAFEESMLETIADDADSAELLAADSLGRRRRLLESQTYERTVAGRWKQKQGENFHPLWKLVAQISFGMHLLHKGLAKSDEEVIRILQNHVDEIDGFLERTTEDLELAQRDINERVRYLKLPLEHGDVFDTMLGDRKFRTAILEGNEKIEHIVDRTSVALKDTMKDVKKGLDGTRELARYFKKLDRTWDRQTEEHIGVYSAMTGNTEGWAGAYEELQRKGRVLHESLVHLGGIVAEIQRRVGVASRKDIPSAATSRSNTQPSSRVPSAPQSPRRSSPQRGGIYADQRSVSDPRHQQNRGPWTGDRHRRHASADSVSSEKRGPGRKVSFSEKTKNKGSNLAISPRGPHNMSPEDRRYEKSMPKTAKESVPATPWDESNGHYVSVRDTVKNDLKGMRRSMSTTTPHAPYDLDAILRPVSKEATMPPIPSAGLPSATPSTASSYYGTGHESQMPGTLSAGLPSGVPSLASPYRPPPTRMSETVYSPPFPKRRGRDSLPDEAIKEEEEEEEDEPKPLEHELSKEDTESDEEDFHAEIVDAEVHEARPREVSISGRTSPSGSFKPQVRQIPLREVRSIDSLPSQTRGIHDIVGFPQTRNNLKRTSTDYNQTSLQAAVAMLRRSSTFANGATPTSYSPPTTGSSRPPSDLRPAPLSFAQSATAAYFRRPSSPTSVYTDIYEDSTTGSKTPPYGAHSRYGSVSSSAPRSAPPARTSFLHSPASTEASTPTASRAPHSPPADVETQGPAPPAAMDHGSVEHPTRDAPQVEQAEQEYNPQPIQTLQAQRDGSPPPIQSPRAAAPERVPTPPRPRRMGSHTAPERIPTPHRSPELKALTSATVTGPEPDFPYGWNEEGEEQADEPEELDASPALAELSARPATSDGPDPESRRESENSQFSQTTDQSVDTEKADTTPEEDAEDRLLRRRSDTILRKEVEEQRKRDIAAAKRELEELTRANETKKAQADIISRVAHATGTTGIAPAPIINPDTNAEDPVREQLFPTGDTKLLHKPPPVIISNIPGGNPRRGRPSAEQQLRPSGEQYRPSVEQYRADAGPVPPSAGSQYVYPTRSPLVGTDTGLSPPEPEYSPASRPSSGGNNKSKSPWRKVFGLGGSSESHSYSHNNSIDDHEKPEKPEKEKKGLGISLGFGRKSHRKSRSVKEARLAQAAERHSPDRAALSDGRVIRHGAWNSGDIIGMVNGASTKGGSPNGGKGDAGGQYLQMRDEGTVPIPGVGTMDFGRASVQLRREQEKGTGAQGQQIVIGGQNHGIGDVPDLPRGARF